MLSHRKESQQTESSAKDTLCPLGCLEATHCVSGFKLLCFVTYAVVGFSCTTVIELFLFSKRPLIHISVNNPNETHCCIQLDFGSVCTLVCCLNE